MPIRKLLFTPPATNLAFSAINAAERSKLKAINVPLYFGAVRLSPNALFEEV
jgi:hypothetical protein